jgi:hypothetical protein
MLSLLLSTFLIAGADPDPVVLPKGPAPSILVGKIDRAGNLVSQVVVTEFVPVTEEYVVDVMGRKEVRNRTVNRPVMKTVMQTRDLSKATATTARGIKIDPADLARRLEKPGLVVLSADGKPVEAGYLSLFKDDTIVIVVPPVAAPIPGKVIEKKKEIEKKESR